MGVLFFFFFCNDTATTEIYTLSLHDALPILFQFPKKLIMVNPGEEIRAYQKKEYISRFINGDVRPDNRAIGQTRPAVIRWILLLFTYNV